VPAKPSYSHRLTAAIALLEQSEELWVDRLQLEEVLGVSKTVAWRILKQCGAQYGPGKALVCLRPALIEGLKAILASDIHSVEIERHTRLEQFLSGVRPSVIAGLKPVASGEAALAMVSTTFSKLPPNVVLTRTSLHIDFPDAESFLQSLGAVIYALHNDYEEVHAFLNSQTSISPAI